jgi:MraZ protein
MLRGSATAKIDDKGRLKVPSAFCKVLESAWGRDVFVTSVRGDQAFLYPLPVWEEKENKLLRLPSTNASVAKYLQRVSYFGLQTQLDKQGRLVLPQLLREAAALEGDVVVCGTLDHLAIWNLERFGKQMQESPITDEDFVELSRMEI